MRVKLYREHKYVSFALSELERLIAKTDYTDDAAIAHIQGEWQRIKEMLEGHAHHEEMIVKIFPKFLRTVTGSLSN